jgi:hypothetical protein
VVAVFLQPYFKIYPSLKRTFDLYRCPGMKDISMRPALAMAHSQLWCARIFQYEWKKISSDSYRIYSALLCAALWLVLQAIRPSSLFRVYSGLGLFQPLPFGPVEAHLFFFTKNKSKHMVNITRKLHCQSTWKSTDPLSLFSKALRIPMARVRTLHVAFAPLGPPGACGSAELRWDGDGGATLERVTSSTTRDQLLAASLYLLR